MILQTKILNSEKVYSPLPLSRWGLGSQCSPWVQCQDLQPTSSLADHQPRYIRWPCSYVSDFKSITSLEKVKKSLGTGGSLINLKVKSGRTNLQLGKLICISKLDFSTSFLAAFPTVFLTQPGTNWASLATRWEAAWSLAVATLVLCLRSQKKTSKWTGQHLAVLPSTTGFDKTSNRDPGVGDSEDEEEQMEQLFKVVNQQFNN